MLAPCSNVLLLSIFLKETTEVKGIFSLNRRIKERKIMSPPALSTQIIAGLRRIAVESFPENTAEAVSHPEQCPHYSHAPQTASEAQGTGREGAEHPAALAVGSKPACIVEASVALPICAGCFLGFGLHVFFKGSAYLLLVFCLVSLQAKPVLSTSYSYRCPLVFS